MATQRACCSVVSKQLQTPWELRGAPPRIYKDKKPEFFPALCLDLMGNESELKADACAQCVFCDLRIKPTEAEVDATII